MPCVRAAAAGCPWGGEVAEACRRPAPLGERTTAVAGLLEPRVLWGTCIGMLAEGSDSSGCMPLLLLEAAPAPVVVTGLLTACISNVPLPGDPPAAELLLPESPDGSAPPAAAPRAATGLLVGGEPSVGTPTAGELPGDTSRCRWPRPGDPAADAEADVAPSSPRRPRSAAAASSCSSCSRMTSVM
jgi:hypothetical protein